MAISYVQVDQSNVATWKPAIYNFASTLDIGQRCNAAAVVAQKLYLTYPSLAAIQEYVDLGHLVVVAQDGGTVRGYIICVADTRYGGCQCRWIAAWGVPVGQLGGIFAVMGDIAVARYGWLWGRVTNETIRSLLINNVAQCAIMSGTTDIVTYKKPA